MRKLTFVALVTLLLLLYSAPAAAGPALEAWNTVFHADGAWANCDSVGVCEGTIPAVFNWSAWDFGTGLGTVTATIPSGYISASHKLLLFIDHDMDALINGYANEYAYVSGTAPLTAIWEMGEPGYTTGSVLANAKAGTLTNAIDVAGGGPEDISMALGHEFTLLPYWSATLSWTVSSTYPTGAAYMLRHNEPGSAANPLNDPPIPAGDPGNLYFTSTLNLVEPLVPEPGTWVLMASAVAALACRKLRR